MDKRDHYIYAHINIGNNEIFYIGLGKGRRAYMKNRNKFWKSYTSKYPNYKILMLENNLALEEAKEFEIEYIGNIGRRDLGLGTLVNLTNGGDGSNGYKHTNESKEKISLNCKGIQNRLGTKASEITKLKNAENARNRIWSEESRNKISLAKMGNKYMLGKKRSEETKNKMRLSQKNKSVLMFDLNNVFIEEYSSIHECAAKNNTKPTQISRVCNGMRRKFKNKIFKFKNV